MSGHSGVCVNDAADVIDHIKRAEAKIEYYLKTRSKESAADNDLNDTIDYCTFTLSEAKRLIGTLNVGS